MPYGIAPNLKNVTCFDRWAPMAQAKAHPTLLWSFGRQRSAGIKYGGPGISKFHFSGMLIYVKKSLS